MRKPVKLKDDCGAVVGRRAMPANRWAVLLAGDQTRERIDPLFHRNRQVSVLSRAHERYFSGAIAEAAESRALVQPENRGTGVAIALASLHILSCDRDAMVSVFPCDHYYSDEESFRSTILSAENCAVRHPGSIVLVGAEAEYPEADYGWIEPGAEVSQTGAGPLCRVKRFWEKPIRVRPPN